MSSIVNIHIINTIDDISKIDLYSVLNSITLTGNIIHIYLYGIKDSQWKKHLDEIMSSVLIKHHTVTYIELDRFSELYDKIKMINKSTRGVESFEYGIISSNVVTPLFIPINALINLASKYKLDDTSYIKFNRKDQVKYRGSKLTCMVYTELLTMLKTLVNKYRPDLSLTMLHISQLDKELPDIEDSKLMSMNKPKLSMFDRVLNNEVISCSIFTSYTTVEHLIKEHTKDKPSNNIFIVLDKINRSTAVNSNNNSYYIQTDDYITTSILNTIYFIILKNIFKYKR